MSDIERYEAPAVASALPAAAHALVEWAEAAHAAHALAESLVRTSFSPDQFKGKPGEATAAILAGAEVGLSPIAALRSFDIIGGVAAPRALTLRAVVLSQGHELVTVEQTPTKAVVKGRRRGTQDWQTSTWTIDRARQLNLLQRQGWKTQPMAMLVARATAECARWVAADAVLGIGYAVEELDDTTPTTGPVRRRNLQKMITPPPEPDLQPETPPPAPETVDVELPDDDEPDPDDAGPDPISGQQSKLLHKLLRDRYGDDRDSALTGISEQVRRPIDTTSELSVSEASELISWLEPNIDDVEWGTQ